MSHIFLVKLLKSTTAHVLQLSKIYIIYNLL